MVKSIYCYVRCAPVFQAIKLAEDRYLRVRNVSFNVNLSRIMYFIQYVY
jgi:hypothetical protein